MSFRYNLNLNIALVIVSVNYCFIRWPLVGATPHAAQAPALRVWLPKVKGKHRGLPLQLWLKRYLRLRIIHRITHDLHTFPH